jgi:hypothetical protein
MYDNFFDDSVLQGNDLSEETAALNRQGKVSEIKLNGAV